MNGADKIFVTGFLAVGAALVVFLMCLNNHTRPTTFHSILDCQRVHGMDCVLDAGRWHGRTR